VFGISVSYRHPFNFYLTAFLARNSIHHVTSKIEKTAVMFNRQPPMYFYRITDTTSHIATSIGQGHVVDMDDLEEKWTAHGGLLFSMDVIGESVYYILLARPFHHEQWLHIDSQPTSQDSDADRHARPFLFLLEKRLQQRLRTRKIIKDYACEAKRRINSSQASPTSTEKEILLSLLERVMPQKKGEELYWFRDYEYALLKEAIDEIKRDMNRTETHLVPCNTPSANPCNMPSANPCNMPWNSLEEMLSRQCC